MSVNDDLGDIEFDLIDEELDSEDTVNDVFARDTAIPAASEHLSAETLRPEKGGSEEESREDEENELEALGSPASSPASSQASSQAKQRNHPKVPPPPPMRAQQLAPMTMEPSSEDLEFDSFDPPVDVFGQPIPGVLPQAAAQRPAYGQSEMPTAPPMAARSLLEQAKRSSPAPGRAQRPAFMTETARNPPATADLLARATLPGGRPQGGRPQGGKLQGGKLQGGLPGGKLPEPHQDSALDFVDGLDPLLDSLAPMSGLAAPEAPAERQRAGPEQMQECYAVGDFSRALSIAEEILARSPDDVTARRCAQNCRDVLTQMFAARIGPLDQVITVAIGPEEVQWLALDHRAGFLLSLVDGQSTVDEILDISGMTRLDALKIIFDLTERQVVRLA